jgi:hypothetical protein
MLTKSSNSRLLNEGGAIAFLQELRRREVSFRVGCLQCDSLVFACCILNTIASRELSTIKSARYEFESGKLQDSTG